MKKCPYCGKEYPDDATVCIIDTEVLVEHPPKPKVEEDPQPLPDVKPAATAPDLLWPDYQWSARDAWKCIGMIILLTEIILPAAYYLLRSFFPIFYRSEIASMCHGILFFTLWMVTACYFARTETFASIKKAFGLDHKPTNLVWFGLVMTLILRFVFHFLHVHSWDGRIYNYRIASFQNIISQRISSLILAPIFEEIVNRGFLYKAFRRSHSVAFSVFVMVAWTLWTHFGYWYYSWLSALYYCAWTILQCYLREKSPSLWDCVICHFVSNAVILLY